MPNEFNPPANRINRPYEHPAYRGGGGQRFAPGDAYKGGLKAFKQGVRGLPGDIASLFDMANSLNTQALKMQHPEMKFGKATQGLVSLQARIDKLTGKDPNYQADRPWQHMMQFAGSMADVPAGYGLTKLGKVVKPFTSVAGQSLRKSPVMSQGGMIGSTGAKNADLKALEVAKRLKADGVDPDTIYAQTRWWLDHPDGRPRFEIDDSGARLSDNPDLFRQYGVESSGRNIKETAEARLQDAIQLRKEGISEKKIYKLTGYVDQGNGLEDFYTGSAPKAFEHDVLADAYNLDDTGINYRFKDGSIGGSYYPGKDNIDIFATDLKQGLPIRDSATAKTNTLHELQHAIQGRENMARGGSPEAMADEFTINRARLGFLDKNEDLRHILNLVAEEQDNLILSDINPSKLDEALKASTRKFEEMYPEYKTYRDTYKKIAGRTGDGVKDYRRLAGEAEARLVQNRMNMPMDERLADPFYKNFDVPLDDQIVRFGDGTSLSQKPAGLPIDAVKRRGVSGDDLLNVEDLIEELNGVGAKINESGMVTLYHRTTPKAAAEIARTGKMSAKEPDIFFSTSRDSEYGMGFGDDVIEVELPVEQLRLDDIFAGRDASVSIPVKGPIGTPINVNVVKQQLPTDTPSRMARARDMGFGDDMYHASQQDITEFKPGYEDGLTFVTPKQEFANKWLGKGKYRGRIGTEDEIAALTAEQREIRKSFFDFDKLDKLEGDEFNNAYDEMSAAYRKATPVKADDAYSTIYPIRTNVKKTFNAETDYKEIEDFLLSLDGKDGRTGMKELVDKGHHKHGNWIIYENKDVVAELKRRGYDSMMIAENVDGAQETIAIFDPKNIRSKFAQFDPSKKNSANLLAGGAAGAVGLNYINRGER